MALAKAVFIAVPSKIADVVGQRVDGVDPNEALGNLLGMAIETIEVAERPGVRQALCWWQVVPDAAFDEMAMRVLAIAAQRAGPVTSCARRRWPGRVAEEDSRRREARGSFGGQGTNVADGRGSRSDGQSGFEAEAESPSVGQDGHRVDAVGAHPENFPVRVRPLAESRVDLLLQVSGGQNLGVGWIIAVLNVLSGEFGENTIARTTEEIGGQGVETEGLCREAALVEPVPPSEVGELEDVHFMVASQSPDSGRGRQIENPR